MRSEGAAQSLGEPSFSPASSLGFGHLQAVDGMKEKQTGAEEREGPQKHQREGKE